MCDMSSNQRQEEASRIAGQFDTLRDRVIAAEYSDKVNDHEVSEMRADLDALSSKYFELTGEVLR